MTGYEFNNQKDTIINIKAGFITGYFYSNADFTNTNDGCRFVWITTGYGGTGYQFDAALHMG
jgi:hypothetical protein